MERVFFLIPVGLGLIALAISMTFPMLSLAFSALSLIVLIIELLFF